MKSKAVIIIIIFILALPAIEIIIKIASPILGEWGIPNQETARDNYFFYTDRADFKDDTSTCIGRFEDAGIMPETCFDNNNEVYSILGSIRNKPHVLGLDYNPQRFMYSGFSFYGLLISLSKLAFNGNLQGHCYGDNQISEEGYNMSNDEEESLYFLGEEHKSNILKSRPASVASDFMFSNDEPSNVERYFPSYALNYRIGGTRTNEHQLEYQMLLGWLLLADAEIGSLGLQLFEDDCSFYKSMYPVQVLNSGLPAEKVRKDFAEFMRVTLARMEYFEKVLNRNSVEQGILYMSYYPGYGKLWAIAKIPQDELESSAITIDSQKYPAEIDYPVVWVNVSGLGDGEHELTIGTHTLIFYVSNARLFVRKDQWIVNEDGLILAFVNYDDRDIVINGIDVSGSDVSCSADGDILVEANPEQVDRGGFMDINTTPLYVNCPGMTSLNSVDLNAAIRWRYSDEEADHIINGELYGSVQ